MELARRGAPLVVGVDFSIVTTKAARERSTRLGSAIQYVKADVMSVPLRDRSADLVYTGKGALVWLPDIQEWAREVARILRPGGHLFLYAHPAVCLWTGDPEVTAIRTDICYFGGTRVNDTFPDSAKVTGGAVSVADVVEWQWTVADVVNAALAAGLDVLHLGEYPEPFWRPDGQDAAACEDRSRTVSRSWLAAHRTDSATAVGVRHPPARILPNACRPTRRRPPWPGP